MSANGSSPSISVVICTHDERRYDEVVAAVHSIERQTYPALESMVVVDHNRPLFERLRAAFPELTVLENGGPQGAPSSKNTGALIANGDVVAFLDDDAVAADDWLEEIANAHRTHPTILGVGGWTEPAWERSQPPWFPVEFGWVVGASYRGLPDAGKPVRNATGGNMSVDRRAYVEAGGFDVNLGKVARARGVSALNFNELTTALQPELCPGDELDLALVKPGKEKHQAVGYLPNGAMIVVNQAAPFLGETVAVTVSSTLQTSAGRMIFAEMKARG